MTIVLHEDFDAIAHAESMAAMVRGRESARAFCPDVSPPDNSCSPANKGEGVAPVDVVDRMREYTERFNGSSLARPGFLLGMGDLDVNPVEFSTFLERHGQEYEASPLPPDIARGEPNSCYANASRLVINDPDLDYVEGFAYPDGPMSGMGVLHAWAVNRKTGQIIDNTWDNPEKARYFGVAYERKKYIRHLAKTKYFGVFGGGDPAVARRVIKKGSL